jgi:GTPase-associated system-like protein
MAMHPDFSRWYREVELSSDPAVHQRRSTAVAALADAAKLPDVELLIRVAYRLREPKPDARQRVIKLLVQADDTFEPTGNDREFEVLAGATLAALFGKPSRIGATAGLAVSTASLLGTRKSHTPMDLAKLAEQALVQHAESARDREPLPKLIDPKKELKLDIATAQAKAREAHSPEHVALSLGLVTDSVTATLKSLVGKFQGAIDTLHQQLQLQDEELNMLWWLVGGKSWDLKCNFGEVPKSAAVLVLAAELAKLTRALPGPNSVGALLARAGVDSAPLTIPKVVNAAPPAWSEPCLSGMKVSSVLHPVHFAMERRAETGEDTDWIAGWAAATGVDANSALSGSDLAMQFYRERLLALLAKDL